MHQLLNKLNIQKDQHILVHSSFRRIRKEFPGITIENFIEELKYRITPKGSIVMPTFTYCFKKSNGNFEIFDKENSKSKVGAVTEVFRNSNGVIRTSSPTHSFGLWGKVTGDILETNSPESPLGKGSVLEWLSQQENSFVLMLGTDFSSLSFGHFLEIAAPVPWSDYSPWNYLNVEKMGVLKNNEQKLKEIPGCSNAFVNFEGHLIQKKLITPVKLGNLKTYFIPIKLLLSEGIPYFRNRFYDLLCKSGTCKACDERRKVFLT